METIISNILSFIGVYLVLGIIFAFAFLWKGITKVDEGAKGSGLFFKTLIFPGLIIFWIFFLRKWLKSNAS